MVVLYTWVVLQQAFSHLTKNLKNSRYISDELRYRKRRIFRLWVGEWFFAFIKLTQGWGDGFDDHNLEFCRKK